MPVPSRQHRVPVHRADQRPYRDGAEVDAVIAQLDRAVMDFDKPAQLLLAGAAIMDLGYRKRQPIPAPDLAQPCADPDVEIGTGDAHCLDIGIGMGAIAAPARLRIALQSLVDKAVRAQIVIDADDIGRARRVRQIPQPRLRDTGAEECTEPRVIPVHPAAQQIEAEPTALVLIVGLLTQHGGTEGLADILGQHEFRLWRNPANAAHCQCSAIALVEQRTQETVRILGVRMPQAVKTAEPCGCYRLVYRCEHHRVRIAACHLLRIIRQQLGKSRIEQICIARAAAVMKQSDNRRDAQLGQPGQPLVGPAPIRFVRRLRRDVLP